MISKIRLRDPVFRSLQQFMKIVNRGGISLDKVDAMNSNCFDLWDYVSNSQKAEQNSLSEEELKNIFGVLLFPKEMLERTYNDMKWVFERVKKSFTCRDKKDSFHIIFYQALCEAFCEEIFKLPQIRYVQITGYQIALEAPRFQELLKHPTLETIVVTEDVARAPETVDELWYAKHLKRIDRRQFIHNDPVSELYRSVSTYEVGVEGIRNKYPEFRRSPERDAGLGFSDLQIYQYRL